MPAATNRCAECQMLICGSCVHAGVCTSTRVITFCKDCEFTAVRLDLMERSRSVVLTPESRSILEQVREPHAAAAIFRRAVVEQATFMAAPIACACVPRGSAIQPLLAVGVCCSCGASACDQCMRGEIDIQGIHFWICTSCSYEDALRQIPYFTGDLLCMELARRLRLNIEEAQHQMDAESDDPGTSEGARASIHDRAASSNPLAAPPAAAR